MTQQNQDKVFGFAVILCILVSVILQLGFFEVIFDDPYITYRYAQNAAMGNGLTWNPGEHVEGYSNFLFLLMLLPFAFLKVNLFYVSKIIGIICNTGSIFICYLISKKYFVRSPFIIKLIAPLFLASSIFFSFWGVGGLETSLFGFLIVLCVYLTMGFDKHKNNIKLSVVLFLLFITRPEGFIFFAVAIIWLYILEPFLIEKNGLNDTLEKGTKYSWIVFYLVLTVGFLTWRCLYYGAILPNSVTAKMGGGLQRIMIGGEYALNFLKSNIITFLIIIASFIFFYKKKAMGYLTATYFFIYTAFIIYSGGDWMPGFRFFAHIFPIIGLLLQDSVDIINNKIEGNKKTRGIVITLIIMLMLSVNVFIQYKYLEKECPWIKKFVFKGFTEQRGEYDLVADYIKSSAKNNDLIAIQEAGKIPYLCMNLRFIDIVGLNDKTIAAQTKGVLHSDNGSADYVISRKPDFMALWIYVTPEGELKWAMPAVTNILQNSITETNYDLVNKIPSPNPGEKWTDGHVYYILKLKDKFSNINYKYNSSLQKNLFDFTDDDKKQVEDSAIDFTKKNKNIFVKNVYLDEDNTGGKWAKRCSSYLFKYSGENSMKIYTWFVQLENFDKKNVNLDIYANNQFVMNYDVRKDGGNIIDVPLKKIKGHTLEICIKCNSLIIPKNQDKRELAFIISRIELHK